MKPQKQVDAVVKRRLPSIGFCLLIGFALMTTTMLGVRLMLMKE